jgi:hypothetical protein
MSQPNILFFSEHCPHSKKLISKIINSPIYNSLQKVCIDKIERNRIPKWIVSVPMIYLSQPHPSFQNPLKDQDLWMWIEQQISQFSQQNQPPQPQFQQQNRNPPQFQQQNRNPPQYQQQGQGLPQPSPQQQLQPQQNPQPGVGDNSMGFEPYNFMEMKGGIASDNYSLFFKDDASSAQSSNPFPHTYETIGGMNNSVPQQQQMPQGGGGMTGGSRNSLKQEKFEQELAMKKAMRDMDNGNTQARKMDGVPENFNQMWEQNTRR